MSTSTPRPRNRLPDRRRGGTEPPPGHVRLWGRHAVLAALANAERPCFRLRGTGPALAELGIPDRPGVIRETVEGRELDRMVPADSPHQGLVLDAGPLPSRSASDFGADPDQASLLLALDQVTDPRNLGAILRTAAALGVEGVLVPDRRSAELGGVCAKAASGALDIVPIMEVVNLARTLAQLKERGFWVVGLDSAGTLPLEQVPPQPRRVLVLGAEGAGLRRLVADSCDQLARIEIAPRMESLNVSVAAGIALYLLACRPPQG